MIFFKSVNAHPEVIALTDLLILGGGVAGLTSALYGVRAGLSVSVLEGMQPGGQITMAATVDNYPACPAITGWELAQRLQAQAREAGAVLTAEQARSTNLAQRAAETASGRYSGRAMILATGARRKKLGIPGEETLAGHGVSWCATCDGALYRGQDVAVVGGGNTALAEALHLSRICRTVHLIHRRSNFRANARLISQVAGTENIHPILDTQVQSVIGTYTVEALRLSGRSGLHTLSVSALFEAVGMEPNNDAFISQVHTDERGFLLASEDCTLPIPGVWVAGDLRHKSLRQLVTAAADGAAAAMAAVEWLSRRPAANRLPHD